MKENTKLIIKARDSYLYFYVWIQPMFTKT